MRKQLRLFVSLLVLLAVSAEIHADSAPHNERLLKVGAGATLLPDSTGQIKAAVLSVNSARKATLRNAELVTNIVNRLPEYIKIYLIVSDPSAFVVARNPWPERIKFITLPEEESITIWPQDPFLVLKNGHGKQVLLTSREFERADDRLMAEAIAGELGYQVQKSSMYFEGGNIVSDEDHVFIGADSIRFNAAINNVSEVEIVRTFEAELGKKVLVIGPLPQPIGHIDMMMTPLGDKKVLLADPELGARIAGKALANSPEEVKSFERSCEENFFGSPLIAELQGEDGTKINRPAILGQTEKMIELSNRIAPVLDGIAKSLKQFGYQVLRVPFLYGVPVKLSKEEHTSQPEAYPMLTYNNALIETHDSKRDVYLPSYGWPTMDDAAAKVWSELGFSVHPIPGFATSSLYGGALRCCVKVLNKEFF